MECGVGLPCIVWRPVLWATINRHLAIHFISWHQTLSAENVQTRGKRSCHPTGVVNACDFFQVERWPCACVLITLQLYTLQSTVCTYENSHWLWSVGASLKKAQRSVDSMKYYCSAHATPIEMDDKTNGNGVQLIGKVRSHVAFLKQSIHNYRTACGAQYHKFSRK